MIGTHSIKIAKSNYAPVIIIPESENFKPVRKIGIAVDIKDKDEFPFNVLKERLKYLRSEIEIVYIRQNHDMLCKNDVADVLDKLPGFNPKLRIIENKNIAEGIDEYVNDYAPDMLVIYSKKHGLFHKSISNPFILQPQVPTMIISQTTK